MKKIVILIIFITVLFAQSIQNVSADIPVVTESAKVKRDKAGVDYDYRVSLLRGYFKRHNSPLTEYADNFVYSADQYELDWRLVPAISGVESTFGKNIPGNSYNAYGWANGAYNFESWEDSIEVVSKTLRERYIDRGANTLPKIARRYATIIEGKYFTFIYKIPYGILRGETIKRKAPLFNNKKERGR